MDFARLRLAARDLRLCFRAADREEHPRARAVARLALEAERAAVARHPVPRDREAEPGAACVRGEERSGELLEYLGLDPGPVVGDGDGDGRQRRAVRRGEALLER